MAKESDGRSYLVETEDKPDNLPEKTHHHEKGSKIKLDKTSGKSVQERLKKGKGKKAKHDYTHLTIVLFIGPRYPWSDLWVRLSLSHSL